MANIVNLNAETGANFIADDASPGLTFSNTGGGAALRLTNTPTAGASIAVLELGVGSVASAAALGLVGGAFTSAVSLIFAAGANWAGMGAIRVVRTDGTGGWIPVLPDGQVTAAAK
jgi:hypothetical protein